MHQKLFVSADPSLAHLPHENCHPPHEFDFFWSKSILSLYAKLPDGTEWAATRRDDWRAFVRRLDEALSKENA